VEEGGQDRQLLLVAPRVVLDVGVDDRREREEREQPLDPGRPLVPRDAVELPHQVEELAPRELLVDERLVRQVPDRLLGAPGPPRVVL
jgi:hypothetical protein